MAARVERVVTSGTFALDGGEWEVDNNVWLVGDDHEVLVVDAAHDAAAILAAVGDRRVVAIVCTHGHNDHVNAAVELAAAADAEIALHPADQMLWAAGVPTTWCPTSSSADGELVRGGRHPAGRAAHARALAGRGLPVRPSRWAPCSPATRCSTADPGATGRSYSDFATIIASIRDRLLTLPADTVVHTGHGEDTAIGAEAPHLAEWVARGH